MDSMGVSAHGPEMALTKLSQWERLPHSPCRLMRGLTAPGNMAFNMGHQEDPFGIEPDLFWDVQSRDQRHTKRGGLGR